MSAAAPGSWDPARVGVHRSLEPAGVLPHIAHRVAASPPINAFEAELEAQVLAVDATSFADIRRRAGGDSEAMADLIASIVAEHGKLQNPVTGSGGVVMGRVSAVGQARVLDDLTPGELVVPLASLIAVPLELDAVGPVDPATPHVPVRGRAVITGAMLCGRVPPDLGRAVSLTAFDVYPAATYARDLAVPGGHLLILGAGHAGLLAAAAARPALGASGTITAVDLDPEALARMTAVDPAVITIQSDVTRSLDVAARMPSPADLTLVCTSVAGAEGAALVATAPRGTIVFFSTATRFAAAALGADAVGSQARLVIPNGLTDDRGELALDLLRANDPLRSAFSGGA